MTVVSTTIMESASRRWRRGYRASGIPLLVSVGIRSRQAILSGTTLEPAVPGDGDLASLATLRRLSAMLVCHERGVRDGCNRRHLRLLCPEFRERERDHTESQRSPPTSRERVLHRHSPITGPSDYSLQVVSAVATRQMHGIHSSRVTGRNRADSPV